jgi:uncharacterized caspase-like protein
MRLRRLLVLFLAVGALAFAGAARAGAEEKRIALVVGEGAYAKPLATAANDAGLIAQTLQAAGFDVTGARDLAEDDLRAALRDFLAKAAASGPETVAFVYFSGVGLQLEGENYLAPVGAPFTRDADLALHGLRVSDYVKPLAAMGLKAAVVVLDAAHANPFSLAGEPLAGGLALYEPGPKLLLAYNAAPGTLAPAEAGPYGAYAHALAEMIRAGGLPAPALFDQTRLRVSELTKGVQIPWNSSGFESPFVFFERAADAPPRGVDQTALTTKPIAQFTPQDAFAAAVARDTLQGYEDFLIAFPNDPLAKRVRAILAARREALCWRKARTVGTPQAYWSYQRRYPRGPHIWDSRRLLAESASALEPPPDFVVVDFGYPPPPPEEIVFVDRPVIYFDDPAWGFVPPPPPPLYLLPPPPPDFVVLPAPFVALAAFALPVPAFVPVPVYVRPPVYVVPPPGNVIFENIHNSVVVDPVANNIVVANPQGRVLSSTALQVVGAGVAGAAIGAALPHVLGKRPAPLPAAIQPGAPPAAVGAVPPGHALPSALPPHGPLAPPSGVGAARPAPAGLAPGVRPQQVVTPPGAAPLRGVTPPSGPSSTARHAPPPSTVPHPQAPPAQHARPVVPSRQFAPQALRPHLPPPSAAIERRPPPVAYPHVPGAQTAPRMVPHMPPQIAPRMPAPQAAPRMPPQMAPRMPGPQAGPRMPVQMPPGMPAPRAAQQRPAPQKPRCEMVQGKPVCH